MMNDGKTVDEEGWMNGGLSVGDIVRLRSGSPAMTVNSIYERKDDEFTIKCIWFVDSALMRGEFDLLTLIKCEQKGSNK